MRIALFFLRAHLAVAAPWLGGAGLHHREPREHLVVADYVLDDRGGHFPSRETEKVASPTYVVHVYEGDFVMSGDQHVQAGDNALVNVVGRDHRGKVEQRHSRASPAGTEIAIALPVLAEEMQRLREQLAPLASRGEHYEALKALVQAEDAARAEDRKGALDGLKTAGSWLWSFGEKVAVGLTVQAAKDGLGL